MRCIYGENLYFWVCVLDHELLHRPTEADYACRHSGESKTSMKTEHCTGGDDTEVAEMVSTPASCRFALLI